MKVSKADIKQYSEIATLMSKTNKTDSGKIAKSMKAVMDFGFLILKRAATADDTQLDMKEAAKCIRSMKDINAIAVKNKMRPIFKVTNDTVIDEAINLIKSVVAVDTMKRAKTQDNKED
jgi:hypothetical protein